MCYAYACMCIKKMKCVLKGIYEYTYTLYMYNSQDYFLFCHIRKTKRFQCADRDNFFFFFCLNVFIYAIWEYCCITRVYEDEFYRLYLLC